MTPDKRLETLITHVSNAIGHTQLHPPHSSVVQQTLRSAVQSLRENCVGESFSGVRICLRGGQFFDGDLMVGATITGHKLIEVLQRCSAGALLIQREAQLDDFVAFLRFALDVREGQASDLSQARARLEASGCRNFQLLDDGDQTVWLGGAGMGAKWKDVGLDLGESVAVYQTMFENVETSLRQAASGESVDINEAREASEQLRKSSEDGFDNVLQLASYANYDTYTVGHSIRVALIAVYVASRLDAPPEVLTEIGAAGLMHDVGKGRIPHEILYKNGRLDDDERRIISKHPALGAEILIESEDPSPCALGAAWGHHLRYDGSGYPSTSRWAKTSRITSLIQVCDVFEALTAERPYKAAMTPARAYEILFEQSGAFDPVILSAFTRIMGYYPPGTFVSLSDGSLGRVQSVGAELDRPSVRVLPGGALRDLDDPQNHGLAVDRILSEAEALSGLKAGSEPPAPLPGGAAQARVEQGPEHGHDHEADAAATGDAGGHADDCRLC